MPSSVAVDETEGTGQDLEDKDPFRELGEAQDTYPLVDSPCLLLGFRWDTATKDAVCDLDAVMVFFDDNAKALALVDCVQDTYSNVAALIDDSVYNLEGGLEDDLEKSLIDLTRVDQRVTTIVAGVRSLSMTFKAHAVSSIKCVCASLRFRRFSNGGEGGEVDLTPAWRRRVVSSTRIFGVQHETRHDQQNNVVVLFMLSRPNASSPWTVTALYDELRCRDTTALKHLMSGYVASPAISAVALKLPSIPALCAALTSKALPQMKDKFFAEGNTRGLKRHAFVHAVFMHLYQTTKGLHVKADAARVVAMLDELFDQIDINGNDYVDWEEFTSFCIELGIISGKGTNNAAFQPDDFIIDYQLVSVSGALPPSGSGDRGCGGGNSGGHADGSGEAEEGGATSGGTLKAQECLHGPGVAFMTYVVELKQAFYAEKGSHILKALDSLGKPHHQHEFLDPYFVEGQHVTVQTVAHIPGRYLVVFCSDHSVNLMKEVKNRRGSTHGYHCEAKVMHQLMHRKLMWEPCFQRLISIGSDNHIYQWQINDIAAGAKRIHLRPEHVNTITDIVCIPEKELVVTSSLDRRVCVWQVPTWKLRATFRDHTLGIQALSYLRGTLLSAGFDWDIIAWDAERLERIGTMAGHKAPVTAVAQMVCPTNYEDMKAISADCNFELRVWDLSGCISGGNTIPCLMVFRLSHLAGNVQMLRHIALPFDQDLSVKGYSNMLIASQHISSYAARKIKKEFFVPPAAEYNSSSAHFLCALRHNVHIWDATTGEYVRKLIDVSPSADIVSACFALPFERRLILGTEDGKLLLVNYVTGAILDEMQPHTAEVTQMAYCEATKIIISTDYRGSVVLSSEMQCKLKELRKLTDVHGPGTPITGMAYSYRLSKIVTCSGNAEIQVIGFQHLDYVAAAAQGSGEPSTGLAFLDLHAIIVLGDLTRACLWHLDMETFKLTCFAKLTVPAQTLGLSLDVLNAVGILRMEEAAVLPPEQEGNQQQEGDCAAAGAKGAGETTGNEDGDPAFKTEQGATVAKESDSSAIPPESGVPGGKGSAERGSEEGEVWIALGTEAGRLACWTLKDILTSDAARTPDLKLRPVPDCLCPALRSSFNPYSERVEPNKGSQVPTAPCKHAASGNIARGTGEAPATPSSPAGRTVGGAVTTLKAVEVWRNTEPSTKIPQGAANGATGGECKPNRAIAAPGSEQGGDGRTRSSSAARGLVGPRETAGIDAVCGAAGGGAASAVFHGGRTPDSGGGGSRAGGSQPSMRERVIKSGHDSDSGDISFEVEEDDCSWRVPDAAEPKAVWQGHAGSVSRIGSCSQPPCFFTLGEDGYQRIWSVEGKILGQFALPNASDVQLKRRLFRSVGWCFLVDAVRVRPLHEEMTTSLLEEVEKRRAQKTSRGSTSSDDPSSSPEVTSAANAATTATSVAARATTAYVATRAHAGNAMGVVGTNAHLAGRAEHGNPATALAGTNSRTSASGGSQPRDTAASPGIANGRDDDGGATPVPEGQEGWSSAGHDTPDGGTSEARAHGHAEAAAAARRRGNAIRRRAALSTIENQRAFPARAAVAPQEGKGRMEAAANPAARALPASAASGSARKAATCGPTSRFSAAFSAQSVRSGATLGYYGREEVNVLSAISKNPSRIAAYNRITEGKQGSQQSESSPETTTIPASSPSHGHPRTTRGPVRASSSAPALLPEPQGGSSPLGTGASADARVDALSRSGSTSPHRTSGETHAAVPNSSQSESFAQPQTVNRSKSRGVGAGIGIQPGRHAKRVAEQPAPSRTVKMYRNAAREYGRGCSAGQAMWKELQRDVSATRAVSRGGRSTRSGRVGGAGKIAASANADWASNSSSTFLELPQIEATAVSDKASWGARDDPVGVAEGSDSDSDPEFQTGFDPQEDHAETSDGGGGRHGSLEHRGGGRPRGATCAANDWLAATRHGRDDAFSSGARQSLSRGPGWEDTYAFKRSASRRAVQTSGALSGNKVVTRCLSSTPSFPEKWNWDWCNRPMSALPTDRVDFLLSRFDEALSSSTHGRRGLPTPTKISPGAAVGVHGPAGTGASPVTVATEAAAGPVPDAGSCKAERASAGGSFPSAASPSATNENNGEAIATAADTCSVEDVGTGERGGERQTGINRNGHADSNETKRDDKLIEAPDEPDHNTVEEGRSHLVPVEVERRNKELVKLQQKIIALLVKGNDQARRREARERRRGQKVSKKPLAKGPRPGQLGPHYTLQSVLDFRAAFNFVDEDMSGCLDSEEWRRFLDRFKSTVAVINMRSMFLHLDKDMSGSVEVGELVPVIFNKASSPQHHLIRHLIEYENAMDVQRFSNKSFPPTPAALQLKDAKRLFELHDPSESGRLDQKTVRRMLLALRVPQLSWDAFARSVPGTQAAPSITADEFAAGFFEAFVM